MALLLAPYNSSMRLGSGFNSYTGQLCIDNAVVREDIHASGQKDSTVLGSELGDSQVAQSVVFKTEIIEKMSDLTDALDINGALNIKASNIANARGNGTFVNSNFIKESDLNFLISCKVVNQVIQDDSLTKFVPLPNSVADSFSDVFGDCFISGFQVGGEFTALISIIVHDKSQLQSITAEANIAFTTPNFISKEDAIAANEKEKERKALEESQKAEPEADVSSEPAAAAEGKPSVKKQEKSSQVAKPPAQQGISIDADAKIQKARAEILSQNTVTISVSWTGGGQDLKDTHDDWNFETLRAAAIKFPELVAKTPVRTHAILTKYTALRSYFVAQGNSSVPKPISYENAGVYTTMLQDCYLDYKNLYKDLQLLGFEVDAGRKLLVAAPGLDRGTTAKPQVPLKPKEKDAENPEVKAESSGTGTSSPVEVETPGTDKAAGSGQIEAAKPSEEPRVKPFDIDTAYPTSLIGLEYAKRDIRTNMSRILLEVDKIAKKPDLVLDETRPLTFMSPLLFKQYVPQGHSIVKPEV